MAQISLYIEDALASRLYTVAESHNSSVSKYVAALISRNLTEAEMEEKMKKQLLEQLCGALNDPAFTIPAELPWEYEIPRRLDLI